MTIAPTSRLARSAGVLIAPLLAPILLVAAAAAEPASPWRLTGQPDAPAEHVVRMVLADGAYRFVPAEITARPGDRIVFVNESGGPHNVAFDAAKIDDAAEATLAAGMPSTISHLAGPLVSEPDARYTIALDGVVPGVYPFFCMPHYAMKMTGTLTVR